jgi:hypothetical protein
MKTFPRLIAACLTTAISFVAHASTLTPIGTASILGNNYNVSMLSDVSNALQSIDLLNPTITFNTSTSALAAADALLSTFGASFIWDTTCTDCYGQGVRIVYSISDGIYSYDTIYNGAVNQGFINYPTSQGNAFSVAQFNAPVPEPSTYAMLLAGLGLIGFVAYRRNDNSSDMTMAT